MIGPESIGQPLHRVDAPFKVRGKAVYPADLAMPGMLHAQVVWPAEAPARILGISTAVWQTIHDWSGVVMAAGVGVHTALHFRWLVAMTGRLARGKTRATPSPARAEATAVQRAVQRRGVPDDRDDGPPLPEPPLPRYSRRRFLVGAGVTSAAALGAGLGLFGARALFGGDGDDPTTAIAYEDDAVHGTRRGRDSWDTDTGDDGTATSASSQPVVVDGERCDGCGNCLHACPYGVFTLSGGVSVPLNADACTLCGRCLRVCAPGAITLHH